LECCALGSRYLVLIKIEGCHALEQKIGRGRPKARKLAQFRTGDADIVPLDDEDEAEEDIVPGR
jgi:hypothetical protein